MNNTRAGAVGVALAILFSLAGVVISGLLLYRHAQLEVQGAAAGESPACRTHGQWSCDEVMQSDWGYFPFGKDRTGWRVPTAMLGFFYFAVASAWFLIVGRPSGSRAGWHRLALLMTLGGALAAGYLDYIMWTRLPRIGELRTFTGSEGSGLADLRPICSLCLATHVLAGLLLVITLLLWPRRRLVTILAEPADGRPREPVRVYAPPVNYPPGRLLLAFVLIGLLACAAGAKAYRHLVEQQRTSATAESLAELRARLKDYDEDYQAVYFNFANEPVQEIPITADDSIRGKPDARHTIVMFTDLQCPFCREADKLVREKVEQYPDGLRLIVKHYPLNNGCNPYAKGKTHAASCAAAITAEAAHDLGGDEAFWKMYDELFAHQAEFARGAQAFVREATGRLGLDHDGLWKKIRTRGIDRRLHAHTEQAHALGVDSTPVVFFNGRRVAAWANAKFWDFLMHMDKTGRLPAAAPSALSPAATQAVTTRPSAEPQPASVPGT